MFSKPGCFGHVSIAVRQPRGYVLARLPRLHMYQLDRACWTANRHEVRTGGASQAGPHLFVAVTRAPSCMLRCCAVTAQKCRRQLRQQHKRRGRSCAAHAAAPTTRSQRWDANLETPEQADARCECGTTLWFTPTQLKSFEMLHSNMRRYARWSAASALITVGRVGKTVYLDGFHSVRCVSPVTSPCMSIALARV